MEKRHLFRIKTLQRKQMHKSFSEADCMQSYLPWQACQSLVVGKPTSMRLPYRVAFFSLCLHPLLENTFSALYGTLLFPYLLLVSGCSGGVTTRNQTSHIFL